MEPAVKKILLLNASLRGTSGNSWAVISKAVDWLGQQKNLLADVLTLTDPMPATQQVYELLAAADGFLVVTGVYWNSWSSSLQRFLEVATAFENTPAFFGKPVACAVTMDSVGGTDVASRLQAAFSGLGCWSPPCSTLVLSRVGLEAIAASAGQPDDPNEDVWRMDDLVIVLNNLVAAMQVSTAQWVAWPHVSLPRREGDWPASGPLDMGTPRFL
ncbi:NAD(P)H-dependent oxidoreductase [Paraflavitalea pollutisoli]|uniref:NAD(P)H-dependent oxidoreductase n=1 Tax=Paraflavitalea pollutisoli TaxID=3034143 RepID=UPI0023EC5B61|nr:NAD(P)H-dependent oxidoreductase [Paraflavitalea sp. H1-2-19X]